MSTLLNISNVILEADAESLSGRVFGLDAQLLMDALITACAVLFLFVLLSYLLFNPARELLRKRQEKIAQDIHDAEQDKLDAMKFKEEYESKLLDAKKDVDAIMAEGRKNARIKSEEIINDANAESARILARTEKEIELEKAKVKDDVKTEMISVAEAMAGKFVSEKMDEAKQEQLLNEVINEMGEETWQ